MDKSMVKGIVLGGLAVTAVAASGVGYKAMTQPVYAEVLAAREVTETVRTPREECADVAVRGGVLDIDGDEPGRRGEARDASSKCGTS